MTTKKLKSELKTVQEYIEYYKGASRKELISSLNGLKRTQDVSKKNERKAIETLLA